MSLNFNLNDFATTATPDVSANFTTYAGDTLGSFHATANCNMSVSVAQNLFQFWTDSYDMCDNTLSDIMYKLQYDASAGWKSTDASANPLTTEFLKATYVQAGSTTMNPDGNPYITVADDFLRYVAFNLFNTTRGVDLFNNEENVLNSINNKSKIALHTLLSTMLQSSESAYAPYIYDTAHHQYTSIDLSGNPSGSDGSVNASKNPSSKILRQIMGSAPSRLNNLAANYAIAGTKWVKMPLLVDDTISFLVTINSPVSQNTLTGVATAISARTYKIIVTIVSDVTTLNAGAAYPARP